MAQYVCSMTNSTIKRNGVPVRFQLFTAASMKMTAFWNIVMMEAVCTCLLLQNYAALHPRKLSSSMKFLYMQMYIYYKNFAKSACLVIPGKLSQYSDCSVG
jgi:hypothetical protein